MTLGLDGMASRYRSTVGADDHTLPVLQAAAHRVYEYWQGRPEDAESAYWFIESFKQETP